MNNKLAKTSVALMIMGFIGSAFFLTFASAANGTTLYSENFSSYPNGSQPPNWHFDIYSIPKWSVQNGWLVSTQPTHGSWTAAYYTGHKFSDFNYTVTEAGLGLCNDPNQLAPVLTVIFRVQDRANLYGFWLDIGKLQLWKYVQGNPILLQTINLGNVGIVGNNTPYNFGILVNGTDIQASATIQLTGSNTPRTYHLDIHDSTYSTGYIGVATYNCNAEFTNLQVRGLTTQTTASSTSASSTTISNSTITVTNSYFVTTTTTLPLPNNVTVITQNMTSTITHTEYQ